jgi:hypothetical protein
VSGWENLDSVPEPSSPEQEADAKQIGMMMLVEMKRIEDMEKFSGVPAAFNGYLQQPGGTVWHIHMCRGQKA